MDITMNFQKIAFFFGLFASLLLSGCASLHTPQASKRFQLQTPAAHLATLKKIKFWRADGVFSVRETGQRPEIADFSWREFGKGAYRITITSAMGLYRVEIHRQIGSVTLWKNGTHVFTAKTPEKLMQKALGWSLPIHELHVWMKGMPAQNAGKYAAGYDKYGHLTVLHQAGWLLHFGGYKKNDDDIAFPRIIILERPDFRVKIAVTNWTVYIKTRPLPNIT